MKYVSDYLHSLYEPHLSVSGLLCYAIYAPADQTKSLLKLDPLGVADHPD